MEDVNGDGIIDNYDMVKVGNTVPKWTGGIDTSVTWKDLTLSARFDYALGFKAVDWKTMWIMSCAQGTYNTIAETHDTWSPENPGAQYPTYVWADSWASAITAVNPPCLPTTVTICLSVK